MRKHTFKEYLLAVRPWTFPASAMPVVVTVFYMVWIQSPINWLVALLALATMVLFQAAGNVWDDYFDFREHVDTKESYGVFTLTRGIFEPKEFIFLALILMTLASACGIAVCALAGWQLLWFGLAGIVLTLVYPWCKYHVLGDLNIFITYAILPISGIWLALNNIFTNDLFMALFSGRPELWGDAFDEIMLLAVPVGLITVGILHANNTRDAATDKAAGIHTLPIVIGPKASVVVYCCEILIPYVWIAVLSIVGIFPLSTVVVFLTLPFACGLCYNMAKSLKLGARRIATLDAATARIQLFFSLALSLSFFVAHYLSFVA
ncbi:MAG: prenyltransferase [Candidatus Cryptobacteroides sp.]